jgi:glycerol-3-phosphate dehydrogenase
MIKRDIEAAGRREFDLVVVGGGIYGVSLLQEAARRGLSACLCEANDFGGATTLNSLRIVHGGLRYLQTLDLPRFFQSVASRRQFARLYPALVRPLPCLMPLYGQGMKRASVMRMALLMNDVLSGHRNRGLGPELALPAGRVIDAAETVARFPGVRREGLEGAATWSDYFMVSSERILMEQLRDACRRGATAINYAPVQQVIVEGGAVRGVRVRDAASGSEFTLSTSRVVNCAGPQVHQLADRAGVDDERLFRPSLAFNVLLDVDLPQGQALAVAAPRPGAPILFLVPQPGALFAGTLHLPRPAGTTEALPTEQEISHYIDLLNAAIPGLDARLSNVRRVFAGLLPAKRIGSNEIAKREVVLSHASTGGPRGLFSVSGVKWTTATDVAGQVLKMMGIDRSSSDNDVALPLAAATPALIDAARFVALDDDSARNLLQDIVAEEQVLHVDDLVLRRTSWATTETDLAPLRERVARLTALSADVQGEARCG